jgi:hypothetical protein
VQREQLYAALAALTPDVLSSVDAIPPDIAGRFREPFAFQAGPSGQYFVFDRRGHTVFGVDAARTSSWRIVEIGAEPGRIIGPTAFSVAPDGTFVVADAPNNRERVQIFTPAGFRIGGFLTRGRFKPRVVLNDLVLGGTDRSHRQVDSDIGPGDRCAHRRIHARRRHQRFIGTLRHGHEDDREVHLALIGAAAR